MEWLPWLISVLALAGVVIMLLGERRELRRAKDEAREAREARAAAEAQLAERTRSEGDLRRIREELDADRAALTERDRALVATEGELTRERERVAGLSAEDARREIVDQIRHDAELAGARAAREIEHRARRDAQRIATEIVVTAIERVAVEQTAETVSATVPLPNDEMKGRVIGKEGRNIRAFEQATGANVVIDEGPSVTVSCFDPLRRETARLALETLVADGNIHPARIEHVLTATTRRMDERMRAAAEEALADVGIVDLDPELVPYVGRLAFRTSHGQNVLGHLVECAHLARGMAHELGVDAAQCARAAFLHDIGKALTHERQGSHALLGAELLRAHGENPDVVHAVEAHHGEVEPATVEACITRAVDAISASRPGARRDSLEAYLERMEALERIAAARPGVAKAYAMQAGHEVRVMVEPEHVDDDAAHLLAHEIAREIEEGLTYPGQVRVTVVRESRATAVAS